MNRWQGLARADYRTEAVEGEVIAYDFGAWIITGIHADDAKTTYALDLKCLYGEHKGREGTLKLSRHGFRSIARYAAGRVPLCSCCGNPAPCRIAEAERVASASMALLEIRMARAGVPGICYACGEVITNRQESLTYPPDEGNIQLPGYPSPRFHLRGQCSNARWNYAEDRAKRLPDQLAVDPDYAKHERQTLT